MSSKFPMRGRKVGKPPHPAVHRAIQFIYEELLRRGLPEQEVALQAGYHRSIISMWKKHNGARITTVEDILNTLGFKLIVVPVEHGTEFDGKF